MNMWRNGLLVSVLLGSLGAWAWMFARAATTLQGSLALLLATFLAGTLAAMWHYRAYLQHNVLTSAIALGALAHTALAALVVAGDRLGDLGLVPALASNGHHFLMGVLGLAGAAWSWTRARGQRPLPERPAPAQSAPTAPRPTAVDREALRAAVSGDAERSDQLELLLAILDRDEVSEVHQLAADGARQLSLQATADAREAAEDDALSQAAALLEWGAQKLPELGELDVSDLLMAKVIADIRATHDEVERLLVDHRSLWPIHPIDRATANDKCEQRAQAAREAQPLLEAHGLELSEALVAAHDELAAFKSVTGFQVVEVDPPGHYVTFEGNGRREALRRAFPDVALKVEVRCYRFADRAQRRTIQRRLQRVRRWKGLTDE